MKKFTLTSILLVLACFAFAQSAHWTPIPGTRYTMMVNGVVVINGEQQSSTMLEIGAFCGDECRASGFAAPFPTGDYVVFLTVVSNVSSGEVITFRLYDHNQNRILESSSFVVFADLASIGAPNNWFQFEFNSEVLVSASVSPEGAGVVTGTGYYAPGATATLTATPNDGYAFVNWTENSQVVSTDASYSFTVVEDRTLVANFQTVEVTNHWTPIGGTRYTMTVNGVIVINGEQQSSTMLEIGAFCGDECRASGFAVPFPTGDYVVFLTVVSNVSSGEVITFRLYDHALNTEPENMICSNTVDFVDLDRIGMPGNWFQFDFVSSSQPQTFTLPITGYGNSTGGYYLIAPPFDNINPAEIEGMAAGDYDLYYFDEGQADEWRNYEANPFNLGSGKGYLYAHKTDVTLSFTGTPYDGDGQVTLARTAGAEFEGWNLVGNPFAQQASIDRDCYVMNADGTEIIAGDTRTVNPMQGVFVIATSDNEMMTFVPQSNTDESAKIVLNVSKNRAGVLDRAIVRFEGNGTLPKFMLNPSNTKVYIVQDGKDYAVANVGGDGVHTVSTDVCFKARTNGSYTLSVDIVNLDLDYLHLVDNMTGADVDLLQTPSYTFEAHTTDYAERFNLVYATGCSVDSETDTFVFINSNGDLSIFGIDGEATLQVIDVLGHVLSSEQFSGSYEKKISAAPGVYMARLIQGNEVKVQKVVVR